MSLAYMIENDLICHETFKTIEELNHPSFEVLFGRTVTDVDFPHLKVKDSNMGSYFAPDLVSLELDNGTMINTRLLVRVFVLLFLLLLLFPSANH